MQSLLIISLLFKKAMVLVKWHGSHKESFKAPKSIVHAWYCSNIVASHSYVYLYSRALGK